MVTTTNFDSEFCGSLPIHHINTIQRHGAVMLVSKADLHIIQASDNIADYLGVPVKELVGKPLTDAFTPQTKQEAKDTMEKGAAEPGPFRANLYGQQLILWVHAHELYYLIELEMGKAVNPQVSNSLHEVRELMAAIEPAATVQEACDAAIAELKRISGFDGIMMYRFDVDWNGTVISEQKTNGLEPYLGVTFPASDVPRQARELYLKKPFRLIPDRTYQPSRLYPVINPLTNAFTDLSDCHVRGVADVHREYLSNMKVMASMSLRVIHNGRLWGLISCNHTSPYDLNFEQCATFALFSNVVSTKISAIINKEEYDLVAHLQAERNQVVDQVYRSGLPEGLFKDVTILSLFRASGAVLFQNGQQFVTGELPSDAFLSNLLLWLPAKEITQIYSTHTLGKVFDEAITESALASGMLVIPFGPDDLYYLICFRPEVVKTIEWGGNPNEAINFENNGLVYHPRHSFQIWLQTVEQTALPWHEQELQIAAALRSFLTEFQSKN